MLNVAGRCMKGHRCPCLTTMTQRPCRRNTTLTHMAITTLTCMLVHHTKLYHLAMSTPTLPSSKSSGKHLLSSNNLDIFKRKPAKMVLSLCGEISTSYILQFRCWCLMKQCIAMIHCFSNTFQRINVIIYYLVNVKLVHFSRIISPCVA